MKTILVALAILLFLFVVRRLADTDVLPEDAAREHLRQGALVVDVRTVEEFNTRSLTNVVNIPLAEVKEKFPGVVTNKSDVVLLHCRTGRRSGIAEKELRALGYTNVFNIGSFERAAKIVNRAGQ